MDQSKLTDRSLGITHVGDDKWAGVRPKAREDYIDRHIKAKRNKQIPAPKYKIGEQIVLCERRYKEQSPYYLAEVIDFEPADKGFIYFGILLKTTNKKQLDRIGRLIHWEGYWFGKSPANVAPETIKWLEGEKNV